MSSAVYFCNARTRSHADSKVAKVRRLAEAIAIDKIVGQGDLTAIKLHFGEHGNDSHLRPMYVRQVVDKVKGAGGKPFLTDANTLYLSTRMNAVDHLVTAYEHGFAFSVVGAPVIIADGLRGHNAVRVDVNLKRLKQVTVGQDIYRADSLVVLSHFKGHMIAGFGGAIKNLAMGCASIEGKREQHSARVAVDQEKCVGCGLCQEVCPAGAAVVEDGKSIVNQEKCIGCFECVSVCPETAVQPNWLSGVPDFMERMTEYAFGAVKNKAGKVCFMNFLLNVTPDCDCVPWSDSPIVPDIGILASTDPVALDKASYDLVTAQMSIGGSILEQPVGPGNDKFRAVWEHTRGLMQITYGEEIGLGNSEYELISI